MAIKIKSIIFALLAVIFYAINIPISKVLLNSIGSKMLASFLYLGAGIGIGTFYYGFRNYSNYKRHIE